MYLFLICLLLIGHGSCSWASESLLDEKVNSSFSRYSSSISEASKRFSANRGASHYMKTDVMKPAMVMQNQSRKLKVRKRKDTSIEPSTLKEGLTRIGDTMARLIVSLGDVNHAPFAPIGKNKKQKHFVGEVTMPWHDADDIARAAQLLALISDHNRRLPMVVAGIVRGYLELSYGDQWAFSSWKSSKEHPCELYISPDNNRIAAAAFTCIAIWDFSTKTLVKAIRVGHYQPHSFSFVPDNSSQLVFIDAGKVSFFDTDANKKILKPLKGTMTCLTIPSHGKSITTGSEDHIIKSWCCETGMVIKGFPLLKKAVPEQLVYVAGDSRLVSKNSDNSIEIWDVASGVLQHKFPCPGKLLCVSHDGRYGVIAQDTPLLPTHIGVYLFDESLGYGTKETRIPQFDELVLLNLETGAKKHVPSRVRKSCGAFFNNSAYFALGGGAAPLEIINAETGEVYNPRPYNPLFLPVMRSIAISPSNRRIVAEDNDGTLCALEFMGSYDISI